LKFISETRNSGSKARSKFFMKTSQRRRLHLPSLLLGWSFLLFAYLASAASLTWDANTGTTGAQDGSGTWVGNNWWNGTANVTWSAANNAVFGAGDDAANKSISLAGLPYPAVSNIWFKNSGYILTNDTPLLVAFSSAAGTTTNLHLRIDSGKTATIGTNVTMQYVPIAGNGIYIGAYSLAAAPNNAGGTLNIVNGGMVRNTNTTTHGNIFVDGVGTVVNVLAGGTLTQIGTGQLAVTLGQQTGANCTLNVDGGVVSTAGNTGFGGMLVGNLGTATVNLTNNGSINLTGTAGAGLSLGYGSTGNGTFNLNGGTLSTPAVKKGSGVNAVFNFNGGTLKALVDNTAFMAGLNSATVKANGAIIDDGGFAITIAQNLLAGTPSGGLTKLGNGTLTLTGTNTYTGTTTAGAGTLAITTASRANGACVVSNGANLEVQVAGLGASLTNSSLTLGASGGLTNTFTLGTNGSQTVPALTLTGALNLNGTVQVNVAGTSLQEGTYPLIAYGSFAGAGSFVAGTLPSVGTPTVTNNLSAKQLQLIVPPAPAVVFSHLPKPMQVYPRNLATGYGSVLVAGAVTNAGSTQIAVTVLRNGIAYTNFIQSLVYSNGTAAFAITAPILAELASYTFEVRVTRDSTDYLVASSADVVAGDVFIINGQSNAEARLFNGSANGNQHPYLRSFGTPNDSAAIVAADLNWHLAEGDAWGTAGFVGQWGIRMGRLIIDKYGIPVAIINGARAGWPISSFQRNDANHEDLGTDYGRTLFRAREAGVQDGVRSLFWFQGESDSGDADVHEKCWITLRDNWREDFPTIEKFYVFQLHAGCNGLVNQFDTDLRNRQRLFPDRFADVEVMSSTAVTQNTDNCHYPYVNGYERHATNIFRLVQRDLYAAAPQNNIEPPNPYYAYFSTPGHDQITVVMRQTADTLAFNTGAESDFRLEGSAVVVAIGTAASNTLVLTLSGDASAATGLSFGGHQGAAFPAITNANGVGLLAFYNLPIQPGLGAPDVPTNLVALAVCRDRIDLTWMAATNAAEYLIRRDGSVIARTTGTVFTDTTVSPGPLYSYQVAAANMISTSAWSSASSAMTVTDNVFAFVPETANFNVLYQLDIPNDLRVGASLPVPYAVDQSGVLAPGIDRVAYYVELQTNPGQALKWVYVSCNPFSQDFKLLGVPALATGAIFHQPVTNLNVSASAGSGLATGQGLGNGNIEFWGWSYTKVNGYGVVGASDSTWDEGDTISTGGTYGSMQIHRAGETLFGYNSWGLWSADTNILSSDDLGIGTQPTGQPDWTMATNCYRYTVKHLYVLVQPAVPAVTAVLAGSNQFQLSWPAINQGWRLETQTNSLATGLSTNWITVAGSAATNQVTLPIATTQSCVFFRLVYP
jgi:hypothetical protein